MAELHDTDYLSIGEVLGLLLEEFPDVTISKIRFLESQGLIDPERTASGYRKFYDADVELLRVILREQRENYLPLRVIKDRIDSGAIDPSGELAKPPAANGRPDSAGPASQDPASQGVAGQGVARQGVAGQGVEEEVPESSVASHPSAPRQMLDGDVARGQEGSVRVEVGTDAHDRERDHDHHDQDHHDQDHTPVTPQLLPGVVLDRDELCAMTGVTSAELAQLEDFGIVTGRGGGGVTLYGDDAVQIARTAAEFMRAGVDARHLRGWRTAAEREASLYEQLITPRLRQRNPESRAEAMTQLHRLDALGADLRSALVRNALRHHFDA